MSSEHYYLTAQYVAGLSRSSPRTLGQNTISVCLVGLDTVPVARRTSFPAFLFDNPATYCAVLPTVAITWRRRYLFARSVSIS